MDESAPELYALIAEATPVQLWTAQPDGRLDYVNRQVTEYFGRSEQQMKGEGWQDVVHPTDLPNTLTLWTRALAEGTPYRTEFRLQRASDGFYRWHLGLALPVRDENGEIIRWVGSNTDIDDQKRATEVRQAGLEIARLERNRLEQLILEAPAVMAIYRGPTYEIALVNRLWIQFTGRKNAVGKTVKEAFPEAEEQGLLDILSHVYRTGETFRTDEMRVMIDLDEDGIPEETFWTFSLQRLSPNSNRGYDLLVHAVEVSEHVETRRMLEALQSA